MAYIFDRLGNTIDPAEATPAALSARESGKSVYVKLKSTPIIGLNEERVAATFVNDSDEVIYLTLGTRASMHSGIRLNPNGGGLRNKPNKPLCWCCFCYLCFW